MYIYPDDLKAAPTLWLWRLRDLTAGGLLAVFGVVTLTQFGTPLFAAIAALYLFLTVRIEDACILDFIRKAGVYFIGRPRLYRTTQTFLRSFHLRSLEELPPLPGMDEEGQLRMTGEEADGETGGAAT